MNEVPVAHLAGARPFPAGITSSVNLTNLQQLSDSATRWRSIYLPLHSGQFAGKIELVHTANVQIAVVECSRGYSFRGELAPHTYTFLIPLRRLPGIVFLGREIGDLDVLVGKSGQPAVYFSRFGNRRLCVSIAQHLLDHRIDSVWRQGDPDTNQRRFKFIDNDHRLEFVSNALRLFADAMEDHNILVKSSIAAAIERQLVENLVQAMVPDLHVPSMAVRHRIAMRAHNFMLDRVHEAVSMEELCGSVNMGMRALLLGFQETYGAPPIAYLRRMRLNGARRELCAGSDVTVSEVASRWGFLHFGRFSTDYQRAFDEKPSETLSKNRVIVNHVLRIVSAPR